MKEHRPTLKSIAQRVGVTSNTVSLALRDSPLVAEHTRRRIQAVARELGYVQNAIAGSLRSGRTNTVAVVMGDIANPLFAALIKALERALRENGYQMIIFNTDEDPERERKAVRTAIGRRVDGLILCPSAEPREAVALLERHGVPLIFSGRLDNAGRHDVVLWDDRMGGYLAAEHLFSCGCRRIAWLGVTQRISSARDRRDGYLAALERVGVRPEAELIVEVNPTGGDVERALAQLVRHGVDGICAFSDLIAWEAVCALEERKIGVPGDIQITGFDDVSAYLRIPYKLTSIAADLDLHAAELTRMLLARIKAPNRPPEIRRIDVRLKARGSTGAAR
jgi:LacI family transcriptional regulator